MMFYFRFEDTKKYVTDAFTYLKAKQIPVIFDLRERATHSKLLIVDDGQVVLGSHNWTAGSAFAYRDTSIYLRGPELVTIYSQRFLKLWEKYSRQSS